MKLPDFTDDSELNFLRQKMGAHVLGTFSPTLEYKHLTIAELEQLAGEGIEVDIDEISILPDGTLAYKDSRILVYIRDVSDYQRQHKKIDMPRFHVAHCRTLDQMKENNRFARYVVATRDDGLFSINRVNNHKIIKSELLRLNVCQNCLNHLNFDGFELNQPKIKRINIVSKFTIKGFFEIFPKSLFYENPEYRDDDAPLNAYPNNWDSISRQTKAKRNWTCEKCKIDLSSNKNRHYLHAHHENGQKWDIREDNLKVLCIKCHGDEVMHVHLRNSPDYKEFVRMFG